MPLVWDKTANSYSKKVHPVSLSVYQSLTPLSTANMTLPEYESVNLLDMVLITTPDGKQEAYRVSSITTNTDTKEQDVYLEHCACTLGDIVIPDEQTVDGKNQSLDIKGTISYVLTELLKYQPSSESGTIPVPPRWSVGTVAATATIYAVIGGMTILDAINDMMTQIPAYQAVFVGGEDNWHIDIIQRPTVPVCEARLSRNIDGCEISTSSMGLCTRVISSGLDGGKMDSENINEVGVFAENMMLNDNLSDGEKDAIAAAYLEAHSVPSVSVTISGLELSHLTGLPLDQFDVGTVCRLALPEMNLTVNEVIVDKRYADVIDDPDGVTFTLSKAAPDLSIAVAQAMKASGAGGKSNMTAAKEVKEEHKRYETKFEQTDQYFRMLATDSEWEEIEGKWHQNITAYSQIVQTSANIQTVVTQTGTVTNIFDPTATYHAGDRVLHGGVAYKFIKDHEPGAWKGTGENGDVVEVSSMYSQIDQTAEGVSSIVGQTGIVTEEFDKNKIYTPGMKVLYKGVAYRFKSAYAPGPGQDWNPALVEPIPTLQSQISQNATDILAKVDNGTIQNYLLINSFSAELGSVLEDGDQSLAAKVTTLINTQTGTSQVKISADQIDLEGYVTADDIFVDGTVSAQNTIYAGNLHVYEDAEITGNITTSSDSELLLGIVEATSITANETMYIGDEEITEDFVSNAIVDAEVSQDGLTLTLTKNDGTTINFNKAGSATTTLTGGWASGKFTVTATPQNVDFWTLISQGTATWEGSTVTIPIMAVDKDNQNYPYSTGKNVYIDVSSHTGSITNLSGTGIAGNQLLSNVPITAIGTNLNPYSENVTLAESTYQVGNITSPCVTLSIDNTVIGRIKTEDAYNSGETAGITEGKNAVSLKTFSNGKKASWIDDEDPLHPATYYISTDGKGTGSEDEAWIDPSEAIDYGKTLVSVTRTWSEYSGTPTSPTSLESGKTYNLVVKKDGTNVYNEFYTVPSAPAPADPKVSRGTWTNGSLTFTAGTTGEDDDTVTIKGGAQTPTLIQSGTDITGISFDVLEDDGTTAGADTGADITASINTTKATLQANYDSTNSEFVVSRLSGNSINIGQSNAIQIGINSLHIPVTIGSNVIGDPSYQGDGVYTLAATGTITVGGQNLTVSGTDVFTATDAVDHGKQLAAESLTVTQTNATNYGQLPSSAEVSVASDKYYFVNVSGAPYKKFHTPASGGTDRWARYTEDIVLTANDKDESTWLKYATYDNYETETNPAHRTSINVNARAVYDAGLEDGRGGTLGVIKQPWSADGTTCQFVPGVNEGTATASVNISAEAVKSSLASVSGTATVNIKDGDSTIQQKKFYLRSVSVGDNAYVALTDSTALVQTTWMAKLAVSGTPGGESRLISTLGNVKLDAADISAVTKYTTATFNVGDQQDGVPIRIDASDVYNQGLSDGSRIKIEPLRIVSQPLTSNMTYTLYPADRKNAMSAIQFDVQVPTVYRRAESLSNTIVLPASHKGTATISNNTVEYDEGPDTGNFPVVINASAVWQAGFNEGVGAEFTPTTVNVQGLGPYTVTPIGAGVSFNKYGYDKLYYYDDDRERYVPCIDRARYWFYTTSNVSGGAYYQAGTDFQYYKKGYSAQYYVRTE